MNQAAIYSGGAFLMIAALFTSMPSRKSRVMWQRNASQKQVAVTAMETTQLTENKKGSTDKKKPAPTLPTKVKHGLPWQSTAEHRQWGPALLMPDPGAARLGSCLTL